MKSTHNTLVLIHGLWLTPCSWQLFRGFYEARGYRVLAPPWPRLHAQVEEARRDPSALAELGIQEIIEHYEAVVRTLPEPPILVGHSLGGLIVQVLLDRGLGTAGVSIGGTVPVGITMLPFAALRAASPVLRNPLNYWRTVMPSFELFFHAFANSMSEAAAREVYENHVIPGPGRPVFQTIAPRFMPGAATTVDYRNRSRAPLLIMTGSEDRWSPAALNRLNHRRYAAANAMAEYQEFAGRSHLLILEEGWQEVAAFALSWARAKAAILL